MTVEAPAKINLSLRILRKREDGFHELETLMVPVPGLCDELEIEEADEFAFSCDDPALPVGDDNLVVKAVRLLEKRIGRSCDFLLTLRKRIPHGAGLGGGSSDAATALLALNHLSGAGLTLEELRELAAELGSDVPFFLYGKPCWCRGRGELIEPLELAWDTPMVLVKPRFGVSTPDAYKRWQGSRELPGISYAPQLVNGTELVNDLERPVFEKHRFLAEVKSWLLARPEVGAALMSGSGSTMMAFLSEAGEASALQEAARRELDPTLWAWS